ncbi:MAG: type II toxin-antitoxin system RelE/ParE family toxin [Planctomycetaceae bacterium]|nr:type II toxin-antitoxin system RelE/ParE family toxin [Planctomycetaceae bacterium]
MSLHVIVVPRARQDILEIADYLADQSLEIAMRFLDQAEASFERLSQMPELGTVCQVRQPETLGTHVWPVAGFPNHLIFYQSEPEFLRIIRLLHGAREWETLF